MNTIFNISSKLNSLHKKFEDLLDEDIDKKQEIQKIQSDFLITRDLSLIKGISIALPENHFEKLVVLFSRISMFFEAGVFIENIDGQWQSQAIFDRGHTRSLKAKEQRGIKIPMIGPDSILSTPASAILNKLNLQFDCIPSGQKSSSSEIKYSTSDAKCILIQPSPDCSFILFSNLPELWLQDHLENIRKEIRNCFS